jgi:hypothetical protein
MLLRILAAQKLAQERPGQTLQATALVHEAYLRLVQAEGTQWKNHRQSVFNQSMHVKNANYEKRKCLIFNPPRT